MEYTKENKANENDCYFSLVRWKLIEYSYWSSANQNSWRFNTFSTFKFTSLKFELLIPRAKKVWGHPHVVCFYKKSANLKVHEINDIARLFICLWFSTKAASLIVVPRPPRRCFPSLGGWSPSWKAAPKHWEQGSSLLCL